ncbi:sulfatase/phosphatase domain-containing protein [Kribbella sp. NBC_00889]|uniref:sulfatase/phosphatase domain-containing protein n=1 Tax=Kribbella sp. NBC_00889 TaxID=2975974 RepID=UPI00386ED47E
MGPVPRSDLGHGRLGRAPTARARRRRSHRQHHRRLLERPWRRLPTSEALGTEAGLRVPVIVRWPERIAAGQVRDDVVHLADLAPSMLRMAGLDVPAHLQFSALFDAAGANLIQGEYTFGGRDRMDEQRDSARTVRDARFRYVRHRHPDRSGFQYQHYADQFPTWKELRRAVNDEARQRAAGQAPDACPHCSAESPPNGSPVTSCTTYKQIPMRRPIWPRTLGMPTPCTDSRRRWTTGCLRLYTSMREAMYPPRPGRRFGRLRKPTRG